MMKKLLLMLLVVGGVMSASAAKLYVNTSQNASWWTNVRIYAYNSDSDNNGWDYSTTGVVSTTTTLFGKDWYVFDMGDYNNAIVQYFESSNHSISNQSTEITGISNDRFVFIPGTQTEGKWKWYENGYTFRSNVLNNWGVTTCNMTVVDANTLSYTLTKNVIDNSGVDKIWFRILDQEGQIYPKEDNHTSSFGVGETEYYNNWDGTSWSFGIEKPSFDYEKIVVTAALSGTQWTITANAYISKTVSGENQYATFGTTVPVDLSNLGAVTAYTVTADLATGIVSREQKTGNLAANEGVMLENLTSSDVTLSIPVAATADASTSNGLVAFTGPGKLTQPSDNFTYYILSKKNDKVGFYRVNSTSGNSMGANTAYLKVDGKVTNARESFFFEGDETTNIDAVKTVKVDGQAYNLAGQRVAQPSKGLYIVNGKKVIMK